MKRIKLAIIGIVCLTLFGYIQGCNDNTIEMEKVSTLDIPEEYNEVGVLHNEGLEYIFEEIKAQSIEYAKNPRLKNRSFLDSPDDFVKQATLKFCKQNKKVKEHINMCESILKSDISLKSSDTEISNPVLKELVEEINLAVSKEFKESEIAQLKAQLDGINKKAAATLSEKEAAVIYCATSTGYNSYQYWQKNYKKWYFALHYPEILEQYSNEELNQLQLKNGRIKTKADYICFDCIWRAVESWWGSASNAFVNWWDNGGKETVIADVGGAVYGAIKGIEVTASTAGVGWSAIPIGAFTEAVYVSGGTSVVLWLF
jgi:hypothetical protein